MAPDLITIMDLDSHETILCECLKYGLRVLVIVIPPHDYLTTPQALQIVGPRAFGYDHVTYARSAQYKVPISVLDDPSIRQNLPLE